MSVFVTPIPPVGELYPQPQATSDGYASFLGAFVSWAAPLGSFGQAIADLQSQLGAYLPALDSLELALGQAIARVSSSDLSSMMGALLAELTQPNPIGTKIPISYTVPQLYQEQSPTYGLEDWMTQHLADYATALWLLLYPPPPPPG